jgi:MFS family permease
MLWVAVTNMVGNSFLLLLIVLLKERGAGPRTVGFTNSLVLVGGLIGAVLAGWILKHVGSRRVFLSGGWVYVVTLALAAVAPSATCSRGPWPYCGRRWPRFVKPSLSSGQQLAAIVLKVGV